MIQRPERPPDEVGFHRLGEIIAVLAESRLAPCRSSVSTLNRRDLTLDAIGNWTSMYFPFRSG